MTLRPYQATAVEVLRSSVLTGHRRPLLQAPTGSGKTVIAAAIMQSAVEKGHRVLFLAPRRELVYQTAAKARAAGIDHGILMAGVDPDPTGRVQVASAPTLYVRCIRRNQPLPPAGLIVVDEAHLAVTPSVRRILEAYPRASVVGLTATPARGDGRGLGEVFDDLVIGPSVADLVQEGFLVPQRYFAPTKPDMEGVRIERGDYRGDDLEERMDRPQLVGDVVSNWLRLAQYRQTVVFATGIKHSIHLRDRFRAAGITAEHLDAGTPTEERAAILARVASGETQVVTNCFLLSYGWDCPPISCAVLARPTRSVVLYLQMVGRILRPDPGKEDALIIDHSGAVDDLGFVDEPMPWTLDGRQNVRERRKAERGRAQPITCKECFAVYQGQLECPECGWKPERRGEAVDFEDGDLAEVDRTRRRARRHWSVQDKALFHGMLKAVAKERGYSDGWAAHKYREKFGVWPNDPTIRYATPIPPSAEMRSWVKSRQVAFFKSREKASQAEEMVA